MKRDVSGGEIDLVLLFFIFYGLTLWTFLSVRGKQLLVYTYRDKSHSSSPLEALLGALTQVPTELGGCPIIWMTNRENT